MRDLFPTRILLRVTEPEHVAPDEMPDPPNDLEGPDAEPPHLQRGSPREGSNAGLEDPSPNVP